MSDKDTIELDEEVDWDKLEKQAKSGCFWFQFVDYKERNRVAESKVS